MSHRSNEQHFRAKINLEQCNDYSSRFVKSCYCNISSLKAWLSDHTFILFAQGCSEPSLVENGPVQWFW